jgi:putative ABC transport system permease protein
MPELKVAMNDLRFASRQLLKHPGFTTVVVLTMALGIGAVTAIFSVVNGVLLRPMQFEQVDRLVMVWETEKKAPQELRPVSLLKFLDWQKQSQTFERMAFFGPGWKSVFTDGLEATELVGAMVSPEFFSVLGVAPLLGRSFAPQEATEGGPGVILLSHGLWQLQYGGDPGLVGRTIGLADGFFGKRKQYTVVGIMPAGFTFLEPADFWLPFPMDIDSIKPVGAGTGRGAHAALMAGKLKPGITRRQAQVELETIHRRFAATPPADARERGVSVASLHERLVRNVRGLLYFFQGAALLVLLVAAANVANLLLARSSARSKEMAVRLSLGAGRWRIARQLLTESLLLAVLGGALGLLVAHWGVNGLGKWTAGFLPRAKEVTVDGTVLAFACVVSLASGVLFGLMPVRRANTTDLNEGLKEGGTARGLALTRPSRVRHSLVVGEIGISLVLLVGAGLLVKSFVLLSQVRLGFNPRNVLVVELGGAILQPPSRELFEGLSALPGVQAVGAATYLPPKSTGRYNDDATVEGESSKSGLYIQVITPEYFRAMGIPLVKGRGLTEQDTEGSIPVAVVNETFVRRLLGGADPIGRQLLRGASNHDRHTIVGVVRDVPNRTLKGEIEPEAYFSYHQEPFWTKHLVLRTTTDSMGLVAAVREITSSAERNRPILAIETMEQRLARSITPQRFQTTLVTLFSVVGLVLAAVGIYGVVSYSVAQRVREFGIRLAVGAQRSDILRLVVRQALRLVAVGLALGLLGALALARVLKSFLFQVGTTDPVTFLAVSLFLTSVALLASYLPARRASRIDPIVALRCE